ncbi:MAG: ketopantoate reductase family protein, partial [Candidatus Acidiferrum sp.]
MNQPERWPKIAVIGAGAVGGYFGGMLARAGAPVVMVG